MESIRGFYPWRFGGKTQVRCPAFPGEEANSRQVQYEIHVKYATVDGRNPAPVMV